jgi:hypothetical protein
VPPKGVVLLLALGSLLSTIETVCCAEGLRPSARVYSCTLGDWHFSTLAGWPSMSTFHIAWDCSFTETFVAPVNATETAEFAQASRTPKMCVFFRLAAPRPRCR